MTHERNVVAVQWPGLHSLKTARDAVRKGAEVEIELPEGTHYTLYRHLNPGATGTAVEELDAAGGACAAAHAAPDRSQALALKP